MMKTATHYLCILLLVAACSILDGQEVISVPCFGVLAAEGNDCCEGGTTLPSHAQPSGWQRHSMVRELGAKYLRQYLQRCRLPLEGTLQVDISGVTCRVRESSGYGRSSFRVTYQLRLEAELNGESVWKGTAYRREENMTGACLISEGVRLLLVKKGVNDLVGALSRRWGTP